FIWHISILHFSIIELRRIVSADFLHEVQRPVALQDKFAHMAHVENTDPFPDSLVFIIDTRILYRHIKTGKGDHLGPQGYMYISKGGVFYHNARYCYFGAKLLKKED